MKSLLAYLLLLTFHIAANAQANSLDSYANQLFFNVFSERPDPAIQDFLKIYIPSLLDKKSAAAKPANGKFALESHGFVFLQHPFFKAPFSSGRLEFDCRRYEETRNVVPDNTRLWFYFDSQQEAETAFGQMVTALKTWCPQNRVYSDGGALIGDFTDTKAGTGFYRARLFLTADLLDKTKFVLRCELNSK